MKPYCIACCGECDANAVFSSCRHFLCARCLPQLKQNDQTYCPQCKQPCRTLRLGDSSFPKEIRDRVTGNPTAMLHSALQVAEFQLKQQADNIGRAKAVILHLQTKLHDSTLQVQNLRAKVTEMEHSHRALQKRFDQSEATSAERIRALTAQKPRYESESDFPSSRATRGRSISSHVAPFQYSPQQTEEADPFRQQTQRYSEMNQPDPPTVQRRTAYLPMSDPTDRSSPYRQPSFQKHDAFLPPVDSATRRSAEGAPYSESDAFRGNTNRFQREPSQGFAFTKDKESLKSGKWDLPGILPPHS